jgi:raffinose/stachyose/melibiose transport system substrate-binding protein
MKKRMNWLLVFSLILVVCSMPVAAQDEDVSITVWTLSSRIEGVEAILDEFKAEHPNIDIEVVFADASTHQNNLKIAAASGTLPTVWFNWGGTLGGYYVENDLTYDFTEYAEENNWDEKFDSAGMGIMTLHDQLSAYPTSLSMVGVFYRADIFEKYGLEEPTTFEEFEAILETLKENGECPLSTAGSAGGGWHLMRTIEQLLEHYAGPELHDAMNNLEESWNNEAFIQTLATYQEWAEKGYFNEGFVTAPPEEALTKLYSGECVMDFEGQWAERNILQAEQDNSLYGVFPFPNGGTNRMSAFGEGYQFNADVSDAELAAGMAFMDYYYGLETVEAHPTNYKYPMPVIGVGLPEEYIHTADMLEAVSENGTFTIGDQALPKELADALFNVQDMVGLGMATPEEGAVAMQEAVEQYLASQ